MTTHPPHGVNGSTNMTIIGIDTVVYGVQDMAKGRKFFADWGLTRVKSGKSESIFATGEGTRVVLRPLGAKGLPPAPGTGPSAREVIWGVKSKRELDRLTKDLACDREVTTDRDGTVHAVDPNGFGIGFRVWRHRRLKPSRAAVNAPGHRERLGRRGLLYDRARPVRLGHVVFTAPDFKEAERFYTQRLGFKVSDRQKGLAVYLRCRDGSDHHNLFFMKTADPTPKFNHLAFEVRDVHEVFGGGIHFGGRGWPTLIGPGRHPVSTAYFWYFKNPCGGAVEYFADCDFPTADWTPRAYTPKPGIFAEWALADGLTPFQSYPPRD